jgi:argininosuccinate synthase
MNQKVKKVVAGRIPGGSGHIESSFLGSRKTMGVKSSQWPATSARMNELHGLDEKAIQTGASKCYIEDLRHEFVTEYLWPLGEIQRDV